jgi:hypothetical protein
LLLLRPSPAPPGLPAGARVAVYHAQQFTLSMNGWNRLVGRV